MELVQYLIVNSGLGMQKGKTASQCAHASISVLEKIDDDIFEEWKNTGMKKVVLKVKDEKELVELFASAKRELPCALIIDAGKTQIAPGSKTVFAAGPCDENKAQKYFSHLKLL